MHSRLYEKFLKNKEPHFYMNIGKNKGHIAIMKMKREIKNKKSCKYNIAI